MNKIITVIKTLVAGLAIIVLMSGCLLSKKGPNTCFGGSNMTNPRLVGTPDFSSEAPQLTITWDKGTGKGAELPDSYFAAVKGTGGVTIGYRPNLKWVEFVEKVEFDGVTKTITISFTSLDTLFQNPDPSNREALPVSLVFPNRVEALDCSVGGVGWYNEWYVLNIDLLLNSETKELRDIEIKEELDSYTLANYQLEEQ